MAGLSFPVTGPITSPFGYRQGVNPLAPGGSDYHTGIDFGVPLGTAVYATHSGTFRTQMNYGGGTMVIGSGGGGWETVYAHLSRSVVGSGKYVQAGDLIGYSGRSGAAITGAHLHYEVKYNGKAVDPRYASPVNGAIGQQFGYDATTAARQQANQLSEINRAQAEQKQFEINRSKGILGEYADIARSQQQKSNPTGVGPAKRASRFGIEAQGERPTRVRQARTGVAGRSSRFNAEVV